MGENVNQSSENPILHVLVIGFHHKKGCQVEYSFPPLISDSENAESNECPPGWKYLPTLALPDGSHNYEEDTVYFHLPSWSDPEKTIFGISCFRQIPVEKLKNRTADITRGTVQKSVCVLSSVPLYGHIQVKMSLITHAYFEEGDFTKVSLLEDTYHHLNACLNQIDDLKNASQLFVGLSGRELILQWRHKAVLLFKLLLLERKVIFYRSPVQPLCSTILTLLSLHPGMLENGLYQSACVQPSRPMSPVPEFSNNANDKQTCVPTSSTVPNADNLEILENHFSHSNNQTNNDINIAQKDKQDEFKKHTDKIVVINSENELEGCNYSDIQILEIQPSNGNIEPVKSDLVVVTTNKIDNPDIGNINLDQDSNSSTVTELQEGVEERVNDSDTVSRTKSNGKEKLISSDLFVNSAEKINLVNSKNLAKPVREFNDDTVILNCTDEIYNDAESIAETLTEKKCINNVTLCDTLSVYEKNASSKSEIVNSVEDLSKSDKKNISKIISSQKSMNISSDKSTSFDIKGNISDYDSVNDLDSTTVLDETLSTLNGKDAVNYDQLINGSDAKFEISEIDGAQCIQKPELNESDKKKDGKKKMKPMKLLTNTDYVDEEGKDVLNDLEFNSISHSDVDENSCCADVINGNEQFASLPRDISCETLGETTAHNNMILIAQIGPSGCGVPLPIFSEGNLCMPYLSLPYMDLLTDKNVRGFIVGATNVLFKQKKRLADVLIEVDGTRIETSDIELRKLLHLTTEDLRFADFLVKHVAEEKHDVFLDGVGYEGGDEWIRAQFRVYLLCLLRTSLLQDGSRELDHFNSAFVNAWRQTTSYKSWFSNTSARDGIFEINPGHPFAGQLSVSDMKIRIAHTMQNTEGGRKINQAVMSTGRAVATTGRAVGGAISHAKGALSNWWSNLTTAQSPTDINSLPSSLTNEEVRTLCRSPTSDQTQTTGVDGLKKATEANKGNCKGTIIQV